MFSLCNTPPKQPPLKGREDDTYDYIDRLPRHILGQYRHYVAPLSEGVTYKLDERREEEMPKRGIGVRTLTKGLLLLGSLTPLAYMTGTSLLNFNDGNGPTTTTSEWGNGVNVMGACSQKHTSTKYKGYADGLFEQLGKSHVGGLGEAQNILEDTGYTNFFRMRQYPLSSSNLPEVFITDSQNPHQQKAIPNHCLNNWNKGESPANKFVVLVGGASNLPALLEDHSESKQLDRAEKELQNTYLISSKHMQRLDDATSHGIKNALNQVTQQIKTEKVKNPEVLIYYSGHGGALGVSHHFPFLDKRSEGEATGIIALKDKIYFDVELKQLLKTLPPDIKTTVIMSTCHAGSWIA